MQKNMSMLFIIMVIMGGVNPGFSGDWLDAEEDSSDEQEVLPKQKKHFFSAIPVIKACEDNYRKKLALVTFPLQHPEQVRIDETANFSIGIPTELGKRLLVSNELLINNASHLHFYSDPQKAPEVGVMLNSNIPKARAFAQQLGVQFLLAGVIRNINTTRNKISLFNDLWIVPKVAQERWIEIDFYLYDGWSGKLLQTHHYSKKVKTKGVAKKYPFPSEQFFHTRFGQALSSILNQEVLTIRQYVCKQPLVVKVVRIAGKQIYFDAGDDILMQVGDIFSLHSALGDAIILNHYNAGKVYSHLGKVQISEVYPDFSIGIWQEEKPLLNLREGDLAISQIRVKKKQASKLP